MPLSKVASGGEISRVMLALKTIFANVDKVSTVVFDEIDTGISGVTSNSVAQNMLELAKTTQIICITHQPIICAKANNFIWITKTHDENTNIKIEILDNEKRLEALAQLASGEITEKTIEFAKTLIKN
jgi:DNA repair protein RecN (Recombination protein N)